MNAARVSKLFSALIFIYLLQILVICRIDLPFGSFDLFLLTSLVFISLADRIGAVSIGFISGLLMDLTPGLDSPIGQWTLIMTVISWLISVNRESIGTFEDTPLIFIAVISISIMVSLISYLLLSWVLGETTGDLLQNLKVILFETMWSFALLPLLLPLIMKINRFAQSNLERV